MRVVHLLDENNFMVELFDDKHETIDVIFANSNNLKITNMKTKFNEDLKSAMKEKNQIKVNTIRGILTEIMKVEKTNGVNINDDKINNVIKKLYSQREESAKIYKESNRMDLFEKENAELMVLKSYLPEQLSVEKQKEIVDKILVENGLKPTDIGKIMKLLPSILDKKLVSEYLKSL